MEHSPNTGEARRKQRIGCGWILLIGLLIVCAIMFWSWTASLRPANQWEPNDRIPGTPIASMHIRTELIRILV
jgi:hypothetical protein